MSNKNLCLLFGCIQIDLNPQNDFMISPDVPLKSLQDPAFIATSTHCLQSKIDMKNIHVIFVNIRWEPIKSFRCNFEIRLD